MSITAVSSNANGLLVQYLIVLSAFTLGFNALRVASFLTFGDVLLAAAAGLSTLTMLVRVETRILRPSKAFIWSLGLFCLTFLLTISHDDGSSVPGNLSELVKLIVGLFLVPYIYAYLVRNEKWLRLVLRAFTISAAINALTGILDLTGSGIASALGADPLEEDFTFVGRARGLTLHPNYLALICAVAIPLEWSLPARGKRGNLLKALLLSILVAGVVAAGSRAALLATALVTIIIIAISTTTIQKFRILVSLPIAVISAFVVLRGTAAEEYLETFIALQRLLNGLGGDSSVKASDSERLGYLQLAAENINEHPIVGAGFEWIQHAHSIYIQVFEAAGIIGCIAFALYLYSFAHAGYVASRTKQQNRLLVGCAFSVMVFLVSGIASNSLYTRPIVLPFAFFWIACLLQARKPKPKPVDRVPAFTAGDS